LTQLRWLKPFGDTLDHHGFYQLLKAHLTWLATHNFSPATVAKRATYVRAFAVWCLERDILAPRLVSRAILEAFQRHLFAHRQTSGKPLAWSSQHLHLKELRQFFSWLAKQNILSSNPAADIELPKLPRQLPGATLSAEEVERIMQLPDTDSPLGLRDRAILEVLYSTGIRRSEVCSLRIDHVEATRQVLFIHSGKGQKDRYVPIGLRALGWLVKYIELSRPLLAEDDSQRMLFLTAKGQPLEPDSLTEYGRRYIKAAGIDKPGACHIYRHTMATLMHDSGADIRTLQAILGHEKLDTTQIYTRVGIKKLIDTHRHTHPAEQPGSQHDSSEE
jgi:integrase/recombinase XerD